MPLDFSEFSKANRIRCEAPDGFDHPLHSWPLSDWVTAVTGEVGEMANVVKKLNRIRDGIRGNTQNEEELRDALRDEAADVFIYLDLLCQAAGFRLDKAVVDKFNRSSEKVGYPAEFK